MNQFATNEMASVRQGDLRAEAAAWRQSAAGTQARRRAVGLPRLGGRARPSSAWPAACLTC